SQLRESLPIRIEVFFPADQCRRRRDRFRLKHPRPDTVSVRQLAARHHLASLVSEWPREGERPTPQVGLVMPYPLQAPEGKMHAHDPWHRRSPHTAIFLLAPLGNGALPSSRTAGHALTAADASTNAPTRTRAHPGPTQVAAILPPCPRIPPLI